MLKAKIHRATVTDSDLNYEGSIAIDSKLLQAAGILPYEQVDVLNITNGQRFTTYAIEAPKGSGTIGVRGAAARLVQAGDLVIICAFCQIDAKTTGKHKPPLVFVDGKNSIKPLKNNKERR